MAGPWDLADGGCCGEGVARCNPEPLAPGSDILCYKSPAQYSNTVILAY